jgi:hypothetical protein
LVIISFTSDLEITDGRDWQVILVVFLSLFPAPLTLGLLWAEAAQLVKPMMNEADDLERRALNGSR